MVSAVQPERPEKLRINVSANVKLFVAPFGLLVFRVSGHRPVLLGRLSER